MNRDLDKNERIEENEHIEDVLRNEEDALQKDVEELNKRRDQI